MINLAYDYSHGSCKCLSFWWSNSQYQKLRIFPDDSSDLDAFEPSSLASIPSKDNFGPSDQVVGNTDAYSIFPLGSVVHLDVITFFNVHPTIVPIINKVDGSSDVGQSHCHPCFLFLSVYIIPFCGDFKKISSFPPSKSNCFKNRFSWTIIHRRKINIKMHSFISKVIQP